ncbi:MAG: DUF4124 domain-containing protein [Usitatibacter sp.]
MAIHRRTGAAKACATRIAAALLCAAFVAPAGAAILYKSVGPGGVLQFSDMPPEKAKGVERILIPDSATSGATVTVSASNTTPSNAMPYADPAETDAAVARASAQLDLAEHALAEARHAVVEGYDPLKLVSARMNRSDLARIEFYKKNVLAARQVLLEVLKDKRRAAVPQTMTASNEWTPVVAVRNENPLSPAARR